MLTPSSIGEELVKTMLYRSKNVRSLMFDNFDVKPNQFITEAKPNELDGLKFDGAHAVDVLAVSRYQPGYEGNYAVGIELKLGLTGLTAKTFNNKFLKECGTSHKGKRITGSMIAILEGKFPGLIRGPLTFKVERNNRALLDKWILVVREKILKKWSLSGLPELSENCQIVIFEDLVKAFGDEDSFNSLVSELLHFNYYQMWHSSDTKKTLVPHMEP